MTDVAACVRRFRSLAWHMNRSRDLVLLKDKQSFIDKILEVGTHVTLLRLPHSRIIFAAQFTVSSPFRLSSAVDLNRMRASAAMEQGQAQGQQPQVGRLPLVLTLTLFHSFDCRFGSSRSPRTFATGLCSAKCTNSCTTGATLLSDYSISCS